MSEGFHLAQIHCLSNRLDGSCFVKRAVLEQQFPDTLVSSASWISLLRHSVHSMTLQKLDLKCFSPLRVYFDTVHLIFFALSSSHSIRVKETAQPKLNILKWYVIPNILLKISDFSFPYFQEAHYWNGMCLRLTVIMNSNRKELHEDSPFVSHLKKKWAWNHMTVSQWWQNSHFCSYSFILSLWASWEMLCVNK